MAVKRIGEQPETAYGTGCRRCPARMDREEGQVTRAEKRKRNLVWRKTAPMFAPEYLTLVYSRYVPKGIPGAKVTSSADADWYQSWGVWDRAENRFVPRDRLMKIRDDELWSEKFATH